MNLTTFLEACRRELGSEQVVESGDRLENVSRDPVSSCTPPAAAVYPGDTREVSEVVKLAAQHGVKIWVYSTGLNWGYCNTAIEEGCVVMILSRMNRILELDEELAFTVLEPGVTYAQLRNHLLENDIPLWTDCTGGPPTGSVVGNALDRGFGVTPYADHFSHLCGLEVVLADGSIVRTGGFGEKAEKNGAWHTFQRSAGPVMEGLFSQSNFGIVVRAGIWLMPEPEHFEVGSLRLDDPNDLAETLDTMRDLMLQGDMPDKGRVSNDIASLTLMTRVPREIPEAKGRLSEGQLRIIRERHGVSKWSAAYGLFGRKSVVREQKKITARKFRRFGKLSFFTESKAQRIEKAHDFLSKKPSGILAKWANAASKRFLGVSLEATALATQIMDIHKGIPNESVVRRAYFRHSEPLENEAVDVARDGVGLIWFVPLLPFRGKEIANYVEACGSIFERHDIDQSVSIVSINARTVVPLMMILYSLDDPDSGKRAGALFRDLQLDAMERGYQQFRCGEPGWDHLFNKNPELRALLEDLKNTLDPQRVLSPGRYGIR